MLLSVIISAMFILFLFAQMFLRGHQFSIRIYSGGWISQLIVIVVAFFFW